MQFRRSAFQGNCAYKRCSGAACGLPVLCALHEGTRDDHEAIGHNADQEDGVASLHERDRSLILGQRCVTVISGDTLRSGLDQLLNESKFWKELQNSIYSFCSGSPSTLAD